MTSILGTIESSLGNFELRVAPLLGNIYAESIFDTAMITDEVDFVYQADYSPVNVFIAPIDPHMRRYMKLISITAIGFHEQGYLCKVGEVVRYTNHDSKPHTITGPFPTFTVQPKNSQDVTLTTPGLQKVTSNQFVSKGHLNVQSV